MAMNKNHRYFYYEDRAVIRCNGFDIIVDLDTGELLKTMSLAVKVLHGGYCQVCVVCPESFPKRAILARFIWGVVPIGMVVDHINRNPLDNRRVNLRLATPMQNLANVGVRKTTRSSSQYKGVRVTDSGTWTAKISYQGKFACLGTYALEKDAAMAYDMAALEIWGEFAALTFPELLPIYQRRLGYSKSMRKVPLGEDLEPEVEP